MAGIDFQALPVADDVGRDMHELVRELFPICRSITGNGLRRTLELIGERVPLEITEVPSGTQVLDWTVPQEWNLDDAWIEGPDGERVVDLRDSNLHVLGYSVPVRERLPLAELKEHLFSLPEHPDWIPFRNSYYSPNWGFCLQHRRLVTLPEGEYEVCIDSTLEDGSLTYGEAFVRGETKDEVLVSGYADHPSMANDNLSGVALMTTLAQHLAGMRLRYSYRFLFSPGTIGPITWLARNEEQLERVKHGLVCLCVGDPGPLTYKKSRRSDAEVDRAARLVLRDSGEPFEVHEWEPWGGDERQFNSPGFDLPVGTLTRSAPGQLPGVPHLGRRSRLRPARGAGGQLPRLHVGLRRPGDECDLRQPEPEGRASARASRALPEHRRGTRRRRRRARAALGAQSRRRRAHARRTWPSARACATRSCAAPRARWKSTRS